MTIRNHAARAAILGKGGKFATETAKAKNRKGRKSAKQQLKAFKGEL